MPLAYGLVPADHEDAVYANLVADIRSRGNHLNTGAIGTKQLLPVLTEHGDVDLAYTVATQTTYPSWGLLARPGRDEQLGDVVAHGLPPVRESRLSGHVRRLAVSVPGWHPRDGARATRRCKSSPIVPAGLTASASISTPRGEVTSAWRRSGEEFELTVTIPGNTSAEIHVPAASADAVTVRSRHRVTPLPDATGYAVFAVGSGKHSFEVR